MTLTGPGGSGKTSLAVEVARDGLREYADGAWFAECAALRDPDYVATTVGETAVIVVRDASGAINAFVNRCAHRGNLLCLQRQGNHRS